MRFHLQKRDNKSEGIYKCDGYTRFYHSKSTLWSHIYDKHKILDFICDYCTYKANHIFNLSRHIISCHLK